MQQDETMSRHSFAQALRSWGPVGWIGFLVVCAGSVFAPIAAGLSLLWARLSKTHLSELGLSRPKSLFGAFFWGVTAGVTLKLFSKTLLLPLLGYREGNELFQAISGNISLALLLGAYSLVAGFSEELFFRGFLFARLRSLFGASTITNLATLALTSTFFGLGHFAQGTAGVVNASFAGLTFGIMFIGNRRRLATVVIAHAAYDIFAVLIIFLDVENQLANLILH